MSHHDFHVLCITTPNLMERGDEECKKADFSDFLLL
jgi:hypothetical protein